ncbi:MAG TPA: alpha/beta fold hydrolase [Vicinamibacterales bacterium]|nr:alpha/beta fold hydrolase [Vicinamibacterales bacterium]
MLPARAGVALTAIAVSFACARTPEAPALPQVAWTDCVEPAPAIRCGSIRVPEDRSSARDRQIDISFEVLAATGPRRAEPVFALSGGPGDASTGLRGAVARAWSAVRDRRDVVLVDQRGTGRSSPLHCRMNVAAEPASAFGHIFDRALVARCREALAATHTLRAYRTDSAADDLDEIRAALGYERIVLWGGSYGSRLAQSYLQRHGPRVAFVVLDGVAPIDVAITGRYPAHLQAAIDAIPGAMTPIRRIAARLQTRPARTYVVDHAGRRVAVTMTVGDFAYAVRGILYGAQASVQLPAMLQAAERSSDLSAFAQRLWERAVRMDQALAHGLHLSVLCGEDVPFISAEDRRAAETTVGGTYILDEYSAACRIWNVTPVAPPAAQSRTVPALLLSGEFDPVTPASMAEHIAAWLPAARLFTAPRSGHGVSFGCAAAAVAAALADGSAATLPPVCPGR